jgi:hypothetical protein
MQWLVRRKNPTVYVCTTEQAASWCADRLRQADIPLSMAARGYFVTRSWPGSG